MTYLESYIELREKIVRIQEDITSDLGIASHDNPSNVFSMIHNQIVVGIEIFSFYNGQWASWKRPHNASEEMIEQIKEENAQRIVEIHKMIFISTMSSFEYCAKEFHGRNPTKLGEINKRNGRIYLRDILKKSYEFGLISENNHTLWTGLLNFRNMLVHNNSISDTDESYSYPKVDLLFKENQMTQGNLLLFPNLLDWETDAIREWIYKIVEFHNAT